MSGKTTLRAQYHFRPGSSGLEAWDVCKLIKAARSLPVFNNPLSRIRELDEDYWSTGIDHGLTVRQIAEHARLIDTADLTFPIILCADWRVMDGMHRIAKALRDGHATIRAVRFDPTPPPDHTTADPDALPYVDCVLDS